MLYPAQCNYSAVHFFPSADPAVEAELERMLQMGVIQEVTEPTEWYAPSAYEESDKVRICVHLKWFNDDSNVSTMLRAGESNWVNN